jgi:hypothetical protein
MTETTLSSETDAKRLQQLKKERDQIENTITYLQEKHIEICRRIKNLDCNSINHTIAISIRSN